MLRRSTRSTSRAMAKVHLLFVVILLGIFHIGRSSSSLLPDFFAIDVLEDGEMERCFSFNGVAVKETSAIITFNGTREGAVLRQMTKGRRLIQMIYDANESLQDCEYVSDPEMVNVFKKTMTDEYLRLSTSNSTLVHVKSLEELPGDLALLTNYRKLKTQCRQLHRRIRRQTEESSRRRSRRDLLMMPGTIWCGAGNDANGQYKKLGSQQSVDYCCRRHDHCPEVIHAQKTKHDITNTRPFTVSMCDCDERKRTRREAKDDGEWTLARVPNTKWCGRGNSAITSSDLGGYASADRCCRQHDINCGHFINAWEEKFDLVNQRPYTAMHCVCDDRFRSCLKQANTAAANMVGKLFFNIIQTKCFVLKPEKVCKKSSWWGKCLQSEWKKKAYLRDPIPY